MKTKIRHTIVYVSILLGCMLPGVAHAQAIYEGQVIDKATDLPLPAVTVILSKKHISTLTNNQGYFKLPAGDVAVTDTIILTSVGYQTYKLPVKDYKPYPYIKMQATITNLNEVDIKTPNRKPKQVILDKFWVANSNFYNKYPAGVTIVNYRWSAKLFNAPTANGKLTSVQLGRQDYSHYSITVNKFTRFNLHIMDVDTATGAPGKILLTKEINLQDNSHMVSIDLSKEDLRLPSSKFFITIERLFIPYNEVVSIEPEQKVAGTNKTGEQILEDTPVYIITYQPFLAMYRQAHPVTFWSKNDGKWRPLTVDNQDTACISATLLY